MANGSNERVDTRRFRPDGTMIGSNNSCRHQKTGRTIDRIRMEVIEKTEIRDTERPDPTFIWLGKRQVTDQKPIPHINGSVTVESDGNGRIQIVTGPTTKLPPDKLVG